VLAQIRSLGSSVTPLYELPPADLDPAEPHVRILSHAIRSVGAGEGPTTGRDGASDAVFFLRKGIPSVEFGPSGGGHHGPAEYVEVESLGRYRQALVAFVQRVATSPQG
jgi:succinyl-diaminopimelate desuccinylase